MAQNRSMTAADRIAHLVARIDELEQMRDDRIADLELKLSEAELNLTRGQRDLAAARAESRRLADRIIGQHITNADTLQAAIERAAREAEDNERGARAAIDAMREPELLPLSTRLERLESAALLNDVNTERINLILERLTNLEEALGTNRPNAVFE